MPQISIILPVYNAERYINRTITSILQQTYADFELIAIDDCSTDSSLQKLKEWETKDRRIKVNGIGLSECQRVRGDLHK